MATFAFSIWAPAKEKSYVVFFALCTFLLSLLFSFSYEFPQHLCFVRICLFLVKYFLKIILSILSSSILPCLFPVNVCWPMPNMMQTPTAELVVYIVSCREISPSYNLPHPNIAVKNGSDESRLRSI